MILTAFHCHNRLPTHRLVGALHPATAVFVVATAGLRLPAITRTGYTTYGALATPIAFCYSHSSSGFAIMIGAELKCRHRGGVARPPPHWRQWRDRWRGDRDPSRSPPPLNGTLTKPVAVSPS